MYCLVCKKDTGDVDKNVVKTKNGRYRLTAKCSVCGKNKSKFIKNKKQVEF